MRFFLQAFKHLMIIILISLDFRVILRSISGVKYHFDVRFSIDYVFNKVNDKQLLLGSLNYTSLSNFLLTKGSCG